MHSYSFETKRLVIRPVAISDAPFILKLMNCPKWLKYIGDRNVKTIESAKRYIEEKALSQLKKHGHTNNVVIRKEDEEKLGTCGIYHRESSSNPDIGFAFLPEYEGQGYAYEAMVKVMGFAEHELQLKEVKAYTMEENESSRKLLNRLGLELVGKEKFLDGDDELLLYRKDFTI